MFYQGSEWTKVRKTSAFKSFLLTSAFALAACGGGGGSGGSSPPPTTVSPPPPPPPAGIAVDLAGDMAKGLILNGYVTVTGVEDTTTEVVTGRSSATDGSYAVSIPGSANFTEDFVRVVVTGGADATMICDAADGCADGSNTVAFGETFPIGSNFKLTSIIPTPADGASATVNVTALTHLVASLALDRAPSSLTPDILAGANSEIADLFGITTSDFSTLPVVDITSADAPDGADAARSGLINAGLLAAIFEGDSDLSVAMDNFVNTFVSNNGAIVGNEGSDDPALISLEDILEGSLAAGAASPISTEQLASVRAALGDALATTSALPAGGNVSGSPSPTAGASDLDKAKAFVSDLQLVIGATESDANGDSLADFADRVETAGELLSDDAEVVLASFYEGLLALGEALSEESSALAAGTPITEFTTNSGLIVSLSRSGDSVTASLPVTNIDGVSVSVEATLTDQIITSEGETIERNGLLWIYEASVNGSGSLSISGQASNEAFEMDISEGSIRLADVDIVDFQRDDFDVFSSGASNNYASDFRGETELAIGQFELELIGTLGSVQPNGLKFDGTSSFLLSGASIGDKWIETDFSSEYISLEEGNYSFDTSRAAFSGEFSEGTDAFKLSIVLETETNGAELNNEAEYVDYVSTTITESKIVSEFVRSDFGLSISYELQTAAEVANLASGLNAVFAPIFGYDRNVYLNGNGNYVGQQVLDGSDFGYLVVKTESEDIFSLIGRATFVALQPAAIAPFYGGVSTDAFLNDPPFDNLSEFMIGAFSPVRPRMHCLEKKNSDLYDLYFVPDFYFGEQGDIIRALYLGEQDCGWNFRYFEVPTSTTLVGDGPVEGSFSASIRQNIAGIDANDPETELSLFGGANFQDDTLAGDVAARVSFAGRRFETNALSFDVLDTVEDAPVSITNQDGVTMTLTKSSETGEVTGNLVLDGDEQATIDDDDGAIIVRFSDGTFVSLL